MSKNGVLFVVTRGSHKKTAEVPLEGSLDFVTNDSCGNRSYLHLG